MKRLPRASLLLVALVLMGAACTLNPQPLPPQPSPDLAGPPTPNQDSGALAIADGGGPTSLPTAGEAGASQGLPALDAATGSDGGAPRASGDAASDAGQTADAPPETASSSDAFSSDAPRGDAQTSHVREAGLDGAN